MFDLMTASVFKISTYIDQFCLNWQPHGAVLDPGQVYIHHQRSPYKHCGVVAAVTWLWYVLRPAHQVNTRLGDTTPTWNRSQMLSEATGNTSSGVVFDPPSPAALLSDLSPWAARQSRPVADSSGRVDAFAISWQTGFNRLLYLGASCRNGGKTLP